MWAEDVKVMVDGEERPAGQAGMGNWKYNAQRTVREVCMRSTRTLSMVTVAPGGGVAAGLMLET